MQHTTRRTFMMQVAAGSSVLAASGVAMAQVLPMVNEKDEQVKKNFAYYADTTKVDRTAFPKHTADQKCSNCALYTGKAKEAAGPCSLFPGKQVAANGWCKLWVKKAA